MYRGIGGSETLFPSLALPLPPLPALSSLPPQPTWYHDACWRVQRVFSAISMFLVATRVSRRFTTSAAYGRMSGATCMGENGTGHGRCSVSGDGRFARRRRRSISVATHLLVSPVTNELFYVPGVARTTRVPCTRASGPHEPLPARQQVVIVVVEITARARARARHARRRW